MLVSEGWEGHFSGVIQCILPRPILDHSLILLDGGGLRRGATLFIFKNMWLKEEGVKDLMKRWWMRFSVRGSYRFILAEVLKMMKFNLKSWNKEDFGNVAIRKYLALSYVSFWDTKGRMGALS